MKESPSLVISKEDYNKISALFSIAKEEIVELLDEELGRAKIVPADKLPDNIVAMNSQVTFVNMDTQHEQTVTLVYPHEADINANKISILTPAGAALIGLSVGQTIHWSLADKRTIRIKVVSVSKA